MRKEKLEINWKEFELYAKAGCPQYKIAECLGIDRDTLRDRAVKHYKKDYSAISAHFRSKGDLSIEVRQYQKAMDGNITMLIYLGKVKLGQKEPDSMSTIPPGIEEIHKDHLIMELQYKIKQLEENANKPQAG